MQHVRLPAALVAITLSVGGVSRAQTVGYTEAIDQLAASCSQDIGKFCSKVNLGGGQMQQCLNQNQAGISAACKSSMSGLSTLLQKRATARASVARLCDRDIRQFCSGIQPGEGNLLDCFSHVKQSISAQCRKAVIDAGYDVSLTASPSPGSIALTEGDLVESLQAVEGMPASIRVDADNVQQQINQSLRAASGATPLNQLALFQQLGKLPHFNIAIQFDFDSARIRPDSFRAIGLIADSLYHPYLQDYRFLIVGHTDAKGNREYNLKLSQQRADAIRSALVNPFGIPPSRLVAIGAGDQQLLNQGDPNAAENRRVQLINIGK